MAIIGDAQVQVTALVAGFGAEVKRSVLRQLSSVRPKVRVGADVTEALGEISALQSLLVDLTRDRYDVTVRLRLPSVAVVERLRVLDERLDRIGRQTDRAIRVQVTGVSSRLVANLVALDGALTRLDGRTITITINLRGVSAGLLSLIALSRVTDRVGDRARRAAGAFAVLGAASVALSALLTVLRVTALLTAGGLGVLAGQALIGGLVALTAALGGIVAALAPLAAVLPAIGAVGGIAFGALKVGTLGFADAIKEVGDPAAFAEAIAKLSPAARETALAFRDLMPALTGIKNATQDALFAGLAGELRGVATALLPTVRAGLVDVASAFNGAAKTAGAFAREAQTQTVLRDAFATTSTVVRNLAGGPLSAVLAAVRDLVAVGLPFVERFGAAFGDLATRIAEGLSGKAASGELAASIEQAIGIARQLGEVFANVGSILSGVFRAAGTAGGGLGPIGEVIGQIAEQVNSLAGQDALVSFFKAASEAAVALAPVIGGIIQVLGALAPILAGVATAAAPFVGQFLNALAAALPTLGPALSALGTAFGTVLAALGPVLPVVAEFAALLGEQLAVVIATLAPSLGPLVTALGGILTAVVPLLPALAPLVVALANLAVTVAPALIAALNVLVPVIGAVAGVLSSVIGFVTENARVFAIVAAIVGVVLVGALVAFLGPAAIVSAVIGAITGFVGTAITAFITWIAGMSAAGAIVTALGVAIVAATAVIGTIVAVIGNVVSSIIGFFQNLYNVLVGNSIVPDLMRAIVGAFVGMVGAVLGIVGGFIGGVVGFFAALPGRALGALAALAGTLSGVASGAMSAFTGAISTGIGAAVTLAAGIGGRILSGLGNLGSLLVGAGGDLLRGLASGISGAIGGVVSAAVSAAKAVVNGVKSALGINSPSKVFAGIGVNVQQGLARGIRAEQDAAVTAARRAALAVATAGTPGRIGVNLRAPRSFAAAAAASSTVGDRITNVNLPGPVSRDLTADDITRALRTVDQLVGV